MIEEENFETYLSISPKKFEIFLFDKKNLKSLYKDKLELENKIDFLNLDNLSNFLDANIFKIEKLADNFIKNIVLIIESDKNSYVNICIKKKNYENLINYKNLEIALTETKDLFKENYQKQNIMHMIIENYSINGKNYSSFINDIKGDYLSLEVNFISIPSNFELILDKILEKYQIKIDKFLDGKYLIEQSKDNKFELPNIANKIINGYNQNEVILVPKNLKNKGFFENFFQLFS
tara:strand:+ start:145 stop:849 length:705 start_codon:yes stop_codon:yes gene_type:complete